LDDAKVDRLKAISQMTYTDLDGKSHNFLDEDELLNLSIRKGSITEKERKIMQNHAMVTLHMLEKIPFTKALKNIPRFAGAHHEFINGKGYPLGLKGDEIPFEGKIMAVTDIAEALTASDRPYKKAMPLEVVYKILRSMAEHEELDRDLVELFVGKNIYAKYKEKYENANSPPPAIGKM
jgi:HD-GYP domain-containing protein (c-di-GMP phosphodiesterase class II)